MRRGILTVAAALALVGPTALAFRAGGYFTESRLVAAIVVWVLVLLVAMVGPAPLPRARPGRLALAGLVLVTAWSALSVSWAPLRGPATENVQRLVLYVGALILSIGVLRSHRARRAVEPALAAGALVVICAGLSGRLLPGVVHLAHSVRAGGRLEQPITYWNAEGLLAAVGLVLSARLAGDRTRPTAMRIAAAAVAAPLGIGVYLSYSRGAIAAAVVGLVVLVATAPVRAQLRAALTALAAAIVAGACSSAFPGVASLSGAIPARERDGAAMLAILALIAAVAGLVTARRTAGERTAGDDSPLPGAPRFAALATAAAGLVAVGLVVGGLRERSHAGVTGARATRLTTVSSNRYDYWRVGVRAFGHHPLDGLGSGGFRTYWLRERSIPESVQEVHSLELEMAAELGGVGLLGFGAMIAGVVLAARGALRRHPGLAVGWCAAGLAWLLHASIDWDWQIPAVALPAIVLAGASIAAAEAGPDLGPVAAPRTGAERPGGAESGAAGPARAREGGADAGRGARA